MAARFWVGQSGGGNYSSTDWATTSGGTTGQLAPTASDDVTFDGVGTFGNTNCTITASANALSLTFATGYTATITLNATFTLTVAGNFTDRTNHTWTINSTDTGALTISAASTITSNGKTFPGNVTFTNTNTKTLSGNWTISGALTLTGTTTLNWTTNETLSCVGLTCTTAQTSGTAKIILTGGTWTGSAVTTNFVNNNLDIQGNVTLSANISWGAKTLTYVSGTVTATGNTMFLASVSPTLSTSGITWNNWTITGTSTITVNSLFSVSGTFSCAGATTFAGTTGFSIATFTCIHTTASTITFANSTPIYIITAAFNASTSRTGSILLFTSDHATNKATLTLNNGATCNVIGSFTRIDASGGRAINAWNGTITTCININSFTDALPPASSRIIHAGATY